MLLLYRVVWQRNGAVITRKSVTDYRSAKSGSVTNFTPTDHGALTGLGDDDHPQYLLVSETTATPTASKIPIADGTGKLDSGWLPSTGFAVIEGTRAEIIVQTPTVNSFAVPTDTDNLLLFVVGIGWLEQTCRTMPRTGPDIGIHQDNNQDGYGETYIDNKKLSRCVLSAEGLDVDGAIRCKKNEFDQRVVQAFRDGYWYTALMGRSQFTVNVDISEDTIDVEFEDLGMSISLITGDSDVLDLDGNPLVQQMNMPIGCYSGRQYIYGGRWT
jgi:hypothetical protein